MNNLQEVTLANLAGGAAIERFNVELKKVLENINNPNMETKKLRSISLKVKFKPTEDRGYINLEVDCSSSLAPIIAHSAQIWIDKDVKGEFIAVQQPHPEQMTFEDIPKEEGNVTSFEEKRVAAEAAK